MHLAYSNSPRPVGLVDVVVVVLVVEVVAIGVIHIPPGDPQCTSAAPSPSGWNTFSAAPLAAALPALRCAALHSWLVSRNGLGTSTPRRPPATEPRA